MCDNLPIEKARPIFKVIWESKVIENAVPKNIHFFWNTNLENLMLLNINFRHISQHFHQYMKH